MTLSTRAWSALRASLAAVALLGSGCGVVDSVADCVAVCDRYKTCFDSKFNVEACADRCRGNAASDSKFRRRVDSCHACIYDRSCTETIFACSAECNGVVP